MDRLLLIIGLAVILGSFGGRVFARFRIPQVVGYIVIGVIAIFIGDELLKQLNRFPDVSDYKGMIRVLGEPYAESDPEWVDLAGLFAPKSIVKELMAAVSGKKLENVSEIQLFLQDIYLGYDENCRGWCADLINSRFGKPVSQLTPRDLNRIFSDWRDSSIKLNDLILKDAEKEFSKRSQIGFGIDGDAAVAEQDFASVRGIYDENKFVKETIAETETIKTTATRWISIIQT